jgi:hypothetical protein
MTWPVLSWPGLDTSKLKSAYRIAANFSRRFGLAVGMLWLASLLRHRRKCNVIKREFVPYCQREACATISPTSISAGATLATLKVVNSTMPAFRQCTLI